MSYSSLKECVDDLERTGRLRRVTEEVEPRLEMAEIQRRVYAARGPALLFTRVKGTAFPCLSNLYGTRERTHYLFRNTLAGVKALLALKADPMAWLRKPLSYAGLPLTALHALPRKVSNPAVAACETTVDRLPQIVSWPKDGGAYITLPQVYTEHPDKPGLRFSNLGMYRIQLSGGEFSPGRELGFHYQIHRGIGVHHHAAIRRGEKLRVSVFVGGPPAHALSAVMPLPEGVPEVFFAGMLAGRRFGHGSRNGHLLSADADFCITGTIDPARTLPEGPFGDHLGYYSLAHPFPVMEVDKVYHRRDAIWPFTVVGRPPQEDSHLAELIHEFAGPVLPAEIPGLHAVHAVEASGVHPLLLALGSERYVPYADRKPRELLTIANAVLGFGQLSLAKYLLIAASEDAPRLDIRDVEAFFRHVLERADWRADLHFQTRTTMDTLDYSGTGLNAGSKVVIAAAGDRRRELGREVPSALEQSLPAGFTDVALVMPGVLAISAPAFRDPAAARVDLNRLIRKWEEDFGNPDAPGYAMLKGFPLVVLVDDSAFAAKSLDNFLWTAFTRSDPARDVHGLWAMTEDKHWGCRGALIIDARIKPYHAPALEPDPETARRVDILGGSGKSLHGLI
ncbi:MAG: 4-hydroxybenzoate decarboxylase subunit [Fibrobacteres bacterium]|nr:4-hydroxybenzoate decarboxylase subunit [Fibrobacterota bacterium]